MITPSGPGEDRPQPPYSVDLLADLHAGVLAEDTAAHVRAHLTEADRTVLAALDRTEAELRTMPVEPVPMPEHVRAMTDRTLASIAAEVADAGAPRDELADRRRRRGRWIAGGAGLAAAAAIAVVLALSLSVWRTAPAERSPAVAQSAETTPGDALTGPDRVAMLSVFGRTDAAPFGSTERLRRCTAANGVPADVAVVGSGPVTLSGRPAAVILLGSDVAGRFTALAVGPDCDTDRPSTISRTELGR